MGQLIPSSFRPAWWLPSPHLQTLWPSLARPRPGLGQLRRRRIELADGDFIDLAVADTGGPRVLVIHGLEGGLRSAYAGHLLIALMAAGLRPLFLHLRGSSGEPNRLARAYHSGASDDLAEVLERLATDDEGPPLAAVGFSLGGNLLLKYLGETERPLVQTAIAASVPFVLRDAMLRLGQGVSRLYQSHLLTRLKASFRRKFAEMPCPLEVDLDRIQDFDAFDDLITAPLNGFAGAFDYYQRCSCRPLLRRISTPTLILHARDDPFMYPHTVPYAHELGPGVTLELARHGGHVGFVGGMVPGRPVYWLERRIVEHLRSMTTAGTAPETGQRGDTRAP